MGIPSDSAGAGRRPGLGAVMAVYLTGLLIGGLYVGMVAPVRTVIQECFGIDDATGIWMINAYTLFYAALIPIVGKLADRNGRKRVFTLCVGAFCAGSAICGLSGTFGGFAMLLVGRIVQAAGAAGMIPVANAEMGTSFPRDKRGLALGLAAGVSGLSNILGSAVGSAILDIAGGTNWPALFFAAVPLSIAVVVGAAACLPDRASEPTRHLDAAGAALFCAFVLCLLIGIKAFDPFNPKTIADPRVWLPTLGAVVLAAAFVAVEHRAEDPIFHLEYFGSRQIRVTMAVSFFIGCCIVSMMLVPQFAEFALGLPTGSGGYYVLAIGLLSLFGPPLSGKLVDRVGPKPPLVGGLLVMTAGFAFLALAVAPSPTPARLVAGLSTVGLGMGFAMGAPTNYMILSNTAPEEAGAAVATVALVRQIGTTVAPALLVGFISSGAGLAGYQHMLLAVAAFSVAALVLMAFYQKPDR